MYNKIITWIIAAVVLINVAIAFNNNFLSSLDLDDDGVCDSKRDSDKFRGLSAGELRDIERECRITNYGDICGDTPKSDTDIDRNERSETSGCSAEERAQYFNYWSIDPNGKLSPESIKVNWLLDQNRGVHAYKELKLIRNAVLEENEGEIIIDRISPYCKDITDYTGYSRNYVTFKYPETDADKKTKTIVMNFRKLSSDEVGTVNVLESPGDVYRNAGSPSRYLREIIIECEVTTHQHKELSDGRKTSFYEKDEFTFFVPVEALVVEPPEAALTYAITVADQIVNRTNDLLKIFDKARTVAGTGCVFSAGFLISTSVARHIPLIDVFGEPLYEIAVKIWKGVGGSNIFSTSEGGGWVGGKAFCRYYACPTEWCPVMDTKFSPKTTEKGEIVKDKSGKVLWEKGDQGGENSKSLAGVFKEENKYIQDNLILSVSCGCVTGVQMNLMYINTIFKEWERCLVAARQNKQYTSVCEQYLRKNLCSYVLKQTGEKLGDELLGKAFSSIESGIGKGLGAVLPETEAGLATSTRREIEPIYKKIERDFEDNGIDAIAVSHAKGTMGYKTVSTDQLICETALYGRLPQFNLMSSYQSGLGLPWQTNFHTSFNSEIVGQDERGKPIYNLEISWFLIAGKNEFCYEVFLENEDGTSRLDIPIPEAPGEERKSIGEKCLDTAGKYNADYIEMQSDKDYDKICFHFDKEAPNKQCFPKGTHSSALEIENIELREDEDDKDNDNLPDFWENRYNCLPEMDGWTDAQFKEKGIDEESCRSLLNTGKQNKLSPDFKDSDGNGINDDKENPDGDAYDNYHEYDNNLNPNVAGEDATGSSVLEDCNINFDEFMIQGNNQNLNNVPRFNVNEQVVLKADGQIITYDEGEELNLEDIAIQTTISGPENYFEIIYVEWNDAKNGVELFRIGNDMKTGNYEIKLEAIHEKGLSKSICVNTNKGYTKVSETKNIVIMNANKPGCADTDNGNRELGGTCYDAIGEHKDTCVSGSLEEWGCQNERCVKLNDVKCLETQRCATDPTTGNGGCTSGCINTPERGSCITIDEKGERQTLYSRCENDNVVPLKCSAGQCASDEQSKISCAGKGNTICYDRSDDEIGVSCVAKCFDSDQNDPNQFGAGIFIGYDGAITKFSDVCTFDKNIDEAYCELGVAKVNSIECPNQCVTQEINFVYSPLGISERVDSAKCI